MICKTIQYLYFCQKRQVEIFFKKIRISSLKFVLLGTQLPRPKCLENFKFLFKVFSHGKKFHGNIIHSLLTDQPKIC